MKTVKEKENFIAKNAGHYDDDPEYQLPEPKPLIYAKTYRDKYAAPVVRKLKDALRRNLLHLIEKTQEFRTAIDRANNQIRVLSDKVKRLEPETERLRGVEKDFSRVRQFLGGDEVDKIVDNVKAQELAEKIVAEKLAAQEIVRKTQAQEQRRKPKNRDYGR